MTQMLYLPPLRYHTRPTNLDSRAKHGETMLNIVKLLQFWFHLGVDRLMALI